MRLAIISDTQYGTRQDYVPFLELNHKFFTNVFWPYLVKNNIKTIVHLGDLVEKRKQISFMTAEYLRRDFLNPVNAGGYHLHWLLGNHDIYFRETTEINAAGLLNAGKFHIYETATEFVFAGTKVLFVPWICKQNQEKSLKLIGESDAKILLGHLELQGFELNRYSIAKEGMQTTGLGKFDIVLTGHYHHRSIKDNIYYVGSHAEFTWADYGDEHGFHILDTDTRDIEFIKNPYTVFAKIWYNDSKGKVSPPKGGFESLNGKIVKVIISSKNDQEQYDWFMTQVENAQPLDIQAVDDHLNMDLTDDEAIIEETKDTLSIIRNYIKQANNIVPVEKLDNLIVDLYNKAQEME